jgi:hypothetical protein
LGPVRWLGLLALILGTWATFGKDAAPAQAAPGLSTVTVSCESDGTANVSFKWGQDANAVLIWVDLSLSANDFAAGTFVSAGPFATNTMSYTWPGLLTGLPHFWRVRTTGQQGETSLSATSTFVPCGSASQLFDATFLTCFRNPFLNSETRLNVNFLWSPINPGGIVQWLDLSTNDNGFEPGTFISMGPLSPQAHFQLWQNLLPGVIHYYRLNTLTADGWRPSETRQFVFTCPSMP